MTNIFTPDVDDEAGVACSLHTGYVTTGNWRRDKRGQLRRLISFRELYPREQLSPFAKFDAAAEQSE